MTRKKVIDNDLMKSWLKKRTTVDEAEKKNMVKNDQLGEKTIPFGFLNKEWESLKANLTEKDELWEFESPAATWEKLCGRKGLAVVRKGEVIDFIITRMN